MSRPPGSSSRLAAAIAAVGPLDPSAMATARARLDRLAKPPGSLGRLEDLVAWLAGVTGDPAAPVRPARVVVAAADHGIAHRGVSAWPQAVTGEMVRTYLAGGAAINALARWAGAAITVVDAGMATGVDPGPAEVPPEDAPTTYVVAPVRRGGTSDLSAGPAMTRAEAEASIELGLDLADALVAEGVRVVATGEMGIGNTTAASAIAAVLTGEAVTAVTGHGTGIDAAAWLRKVARIETAIRVNRPDAGDPVGVLAAVGGFEIGALVGLLLGCAANRIPIVVDGFITGSAALLAARLAPPVAPRLLAAHRSTEAGHAAVLGALDLEPILDLGLRLGEGTGAALALGLLDAAVRVRDEMATFEAAGVSGPS